MHAEDFDNDDLHMLATCVVKLYNWSDGEDIRDLVERLTRLEKRVERMSR